MAMPSKTLHVAMPTNGEKKSGEKKTKFKKLRDLSPSRFRKSSPEPGSDREWRERSVDSDRLEKTEKPSRKIRTDRVKSRSCDSDSNGNRLNYSQEGLKVKSAFTHKKTSKFVPPPMTIPVLTIDDATSGSGDEMSPGYMPKDRRTSFEVPGSPKPESSIKKSASDSHLDLVWGPLMTKMHHGKWDQLDGIEVNGQVSAQTPDRETLPPSSFDDLLSDNKDISAATLDSAELPTDLSDNTEDSDNGEVTCTGHNHFRMMVMNEVFQISVDQMFSHLFTDSPFFRDLTSDRKTFDLVLTPWQDQPTPEGHRQRVISYTLTLNSSLGPKTSAATEKQTCYSQSKAGVLYVVDTETVNSGIPYGDSFYVVSRYCVQRVNSQKCRVHVTSDIKYKKSVWGMVKGFIDKNCSQGIHEYFNDLAVKLRKESDKAAVGGEPQKKKKLRKRRATAEVGQQIRQTPDIPTSTLPTTISKAQHKEEWLLKLSAESLVRILSVILIVLVLFNAVLYYKLSALEVAANYHPPHTKPFKMTPDDLEKYPKSQDDWVGLLKQQQYLHDLELERWKDILSSSITLIEQMKGTLTELRSSIDKQSDGQKVEL